MVNVTKFLYVDLIRVISVAGSCLNHLYTDDMAAISSTPVRTNNMLKSSIILNTARDFAGGHKLHRMKSTRDPISLTSDNLQLTLPAFLPSSSAIGTSTSSSYPLMAIVNCPSGFSDIASALPSAITTDAASLAITTDAAYLANTNPRRPLYRAPRFHNEAEMQAQLEQVRLGRGAFDVASASSTDSDDKFFFSDESDDEPSDCDSPVNDAVTSSGDFSFGLCGDVSMVEEAEDDSFFEESSFARHVGGIDGIKQEVIGHIYDLADSDMDDSDGLSLRCVLSTGGIDIYSPADGAALVPSYKNYYNGSATEGDDVEFSFSTCSGGASFSLIEDSFAF